MFHRLLALIVAAAVVTVGVGWQFAGSASAEEKLLSRSDQSCLKCHQYDKQGNIVAGKFVDVSTKANALQLQVDKNMEIVFFDDSTELKNAAEYRKIPKNESVRVTYVVKDGKTFAKTVEVKKGIAVPKEQLASAEDVAALIAKGPEKGKYVLIDSRPPANYNEGHIPTAVSMPFFGFDKLQEKLIKDKDVLQIYYCAGFS